MTFQQWADRWGLPAQALKELADASIVTGPGEGSESRVQSLVRLEAAQRGIYLWRNNVGAGQLVEGERFIRFGLANDSRQLNEKIKSADLVGLQATRVTRDMVGLTVGRFVSRECKPAGWKPDGSEHYAAQLAWATLVNGQGGDAKIVSGPGSFD